MNQIIINKTENKDILKSLNAFRKQNKNSWICGKINLPNNTYLEFKSFDTSIQIIRDQSGVRHSDGMDLKVSEFTGLFLKAIEYTRGN